jgi:hypothetical protein
MLETLTNDATALFGEMIRAHGKPLVLAAVCSLGVWIGFGWLVGPALRLPGLRWVEAPFRATRPLLSFAVCWFLFYRLHTDGVLDLGEGPTSWARAMMWALLGAAGAQLLNHFVEKFWPEVDNEAARTLADTAVATVKAKVLGDPPPPAGGGS